MFSPFFLREITFVTFLFASLSSKIKDVDQCVMVGWFHCWLVGSFELGLLILWDMVFLHIKPSPRDREKRYGNSDERRS